MSDGSAAGRATSGRARRSPIRLHPHPRDAAGQPELPAGPPVGPIRSTTPIRGPGSRSANALDTATDASTLVSGVPKSDADVPKPVSDASKPDFGVPKFVSDAPKPDFGVPKFVSDASNPDFDVPKFVSDASKFASGARSSAESASETALRTPSTGFDGRFVP